MDFVKKNAKWIGVAGCALILIGCFLPFATVSLFGISETISLFKSGALGIILIIAAIISGAIILLEKKPKLSLITSIISALLVILNVSNAKSYSSMMKYGIGLYVVIIGLVIAIVIPFFMSKK